MLTFPRLVSTSEVKWHYALRQPSGAESLEMSGTGNLTEVYLTNAALLILCCNRINNLTRLNRKNEFVVFNRDIEWDLFTFRGRPILNRPSQNGFSVD